MSELSKTGFGSKYVSLTGQFKNNTDRLITELIMREFSKDVVDSIMFLKDHAHRSFLAVATGTNNYSATVSPAIDSYEEGQLFFIKFQNANTGAVTLALNTLPPLNVVKQGSSALLSGDIKANHIHCLVFDGVNLQLIGISEGGGGSSIQWQFNGINLGLPDVDTVDITGETLVERTGSKITINIVGTYSYFNGL